MTDLDRRRFIASAAALAASAAWTRLASASFQKIMEGDPGLGVLV
jgi:hypothetical protein